MERVRLVVVRDRRWCISATLALIGDLGGGVLDEAHPLPPGEIAAWAELVGGPHLECGHLLGPHVDAAPADGHLETGHLLAGHLDPQLAFVLESPGYVFGRFRQALRVADGAGNAVLSSETVQTINSAPDAPGGLRRGAWDASRGVLRFTFQRVRFAALPGN